MHKKKYIRYLILGLCTILLLSATACSGQRSSIDALEELNSPGTIIGAGSEPSVQDAVAEAFPQAEIRTYSSDLTGMLDVQTGKSDAYVYDKVLLEYAIANGMTGTRVLDETIGEAHSIVIPVSRNSNIPNLKSKIDRALEQLQNDGTMDEMYGYWVHNAETQLPEDTPMVEDANLVLKVGTTGLAQPFTFYVGDTLTGYDIELAYRIAEKLHARVEFSVYSWGGVTTAVKTGEVDIALTNLHYRPSLVDSIDQSDPYLIQPIGVMVRADQEKVSFFTSVKNSFYRTIIEEERWKLILKGLGRTLIIAICASLLGCIEGFLLCCLRRNKRKIISNLTLACIRVLQGTPCLIILMLLYYVIFSKVYLPPLVIASFGLSLNFAAYSAETMKSGLDSVPTGQIEAALALGYSPQQVYRKVIFPQGALRFIPVLRGEFISTVKLTSIVGYISICDLTRAADLIRARTMDAFFPLIMTAIIYFVIASLLTGFLTMMEHRYDPHKRPRKIKGVKMI